MKIEFIYELEWGVLVEAQNLGDAAQEVISMFSHVQIDNELNVIEVKTPAKEIWKELIDISIKELNHRCCQLETPGFWTFEELKKAVNKLKLDPKERDCLVNHLLDYIGEPQDV